LSRNPALDAHIAYRHAHDECPDDGEVCADCCDHSDMDGGWCLICGTDRTEDLASEAYDRAKAAMYGGDR